SYKQKACNAGFLFALDDRYDCFYTILNALNCCSISIFYAESNVSRALIFEHAKSIKRAILIGSSSDLFFKFFHDEVTCLYAKFYPYWYCWLWQLGSWR